MSSWAVHPWVSSHAELAPEKLHALGYLTFAWNSCEYWTGAIFSAVLGVSEAEAKVITHDLGDITIWNKIIDLAAYKQLDADEIDLLKHAAKLYDRCRANRNTYVHAGGAMVKGSLANGLSLVRRKGPSMFGPTLPDSLDDLRRVADDIRLLTQFLSNVCMHVMSPPDGQNWPLPDKPPLPEFVWKPDPPAPPKPKRQLRPSQP